MHTIHKPLIQGPQPPGIDPPGAGKIVLPQLQLKLLLAVGLLALPITRLPIRVGAVVGVILVFGRVQSGALAIQRLTVAALLAVSGGVMLAIFGAMQHDRDYNMRQAVIITCTVLGFIGVTSLVTWFGRFANPYVVLGLFSLPLIMVPLVNFQLWQENPWKFGLCWPVTVLGLCIAQRYSKHWTTVVLLLSAFISAAQDTRGMLVFCCASLLTLLISGSTTKSTPRSIFMKLSLLVAVFWVVSSVGTAVASSGLLGGSIQQKTEWQKAKGGNFIISARTEIPTSFELLSSRPWGYGLGVLPNSNDRSNSRQATFNAGSNPDDALLDNELVTTFRLHSELADLWFFMGPGAFLLLWLIAKHIARGLIAPPSGLSAQQHSLIAFLLTFATWDFFFSPFENNYTYTAMTIGTVIAIHCRSSPLA